MRSAATVAVMLVRLAAVILIALGIAIWIGSGDGLVAIHIVIGVILVLALWALAAIAIVSSVPLSLWAAGLVWGIVVIAFGIAQRSLLPGGAHWVIQVIHLLIGLAAIGLAEMLAARIRRPRPA
jgi:hypothetical protein